MSFISYQKYINEKFVEDSDPIHDLGIGLYKKHLDFKSEVDFYKFLYDSYLMIIQEKEMPKDFVSPTRTIGLILDKYFNIIDKYLGEYITFKGKSISSYNNLVVFLWPTVLRWCLLFKKTPKTKKQIEKIQDLEGKDLIFDIKEPLVEKFSEDTDPIHDLGIGMKPFIEKLLLRLKQERGVDINEFHEDLLAWAAFYNEFKVVKYLLLKGEKFNKINKDFNYSKPLTFAAVAGNIDIGVFLIENGAKLKETQEYAKNYCNFETQRGLRTIQKIMDQDKKANENLSEGITILLPGSYKPLHGGHIDLIKRYCNLSQVKEVKVLIGSGIRNGITQKEALDVAKIVLSSISKVSIEASNYPSPILTAYKFIETADPGIYALGGSKKDNDYDRVLKFVKDHSNTGKYYSLKPKDVTVIELPINTKPILYKDRRDEYNGTPISASILRQDILNNDFYNFETNYPGLGEYETREIWKIVKPIVKESLNEKFSEDNDPIRDLGIGLPGIYKNLKKGTVLKVKEYVNTYLLKAGEYIIITRIDEYPDSEWDKRIYHKTYSNLSDLIFDKNEINSSSSQNWGWKFSFFKRYFEYIGELDQLKKDVINEKFSEDSDPIKDLGIGIYHKRHFNDPDDAINFLLRILPAICDTDEIPNDILKNENGNYAFNNNYKFIITGYILKYMNEASLDFAIDVYIGLRDRLQKIEKYTKNAVNAVNEKFTEDGDPIKDLGIGIYSIHNFDSEKEMLDWVWTIFPYLYGGKIPNNIIDTSGETFFKRNHYDIFYNFMRKYVKLNNSVYTPSFGFNNAIHSILRRRGYKHNEEYFSDKRFNDDPNLKINENVKESLNEGGNVFGVTSSIKREHINPTLTKFENKLKQIFPLIDFDFITLGSVGKKDISNDIDLGLSNDTMIDDNENVKYEDWNISEKEFSDLFEITKKRSRTASDKQLKLSTMIKLISKKLVDNGVMSDSKGSNSGTIFCAFPQYDEKNISLNKNVQIDINVGNLDWLKFSYYSESYEGNVKGLHRTQLIVSLFVNKELIFRHGSGVFNSKLGKYEATNPKEVIELLNDIYGFNGKLTESILNNFYKLHEFLVRNLSEEELYKIYDIYLRILDSTRTDVPSMLQDYWIANQDRLFLTGKFLPEDSNLYSFKL